MCSITDDRLTKIGTAIDALAEAVRAGDGQSDIMTPDAMAERLAGLWAMVADLDPALAHRLSLYTAGHE